MTLKEVNKLYRLPHGERSASECVQLYHNKNVKDIAKARKNAEIEIKFREWYAYKDKTLPTEFSILPQPEQVFADGKARDKIETIREKIIENVVVPAPPVVA